VPVYLEADAYLSASSPRLEEALRRESRGFRGRGLNGGLTLVRGNPAIPNSCRGHRGLDETRQFALNLRLVVATEPGGRPKAKQPCGIGFDHAWSDDRLRHTEATLMLAEYGSISIVSSFLGHTDLKTTAVYARVPADASEAAAEALEGVIDSL
jgi:integrase